MRFWRALGISVLGYYLWGLLGILLGIILHVDITSTVLPFSFWVSSTLTLCVITFGLMQWYFRAHEHYGIHEGLAMGVFFVCTGILLDGLYVFINHVGTFASLLRSYYQTPGFIIQTLVVIATALFVGHAHHRHRSGKKRRR